MQTRSFFDTLFRNTFAILPTVDAIRYIEICNASSEGSLVKNCCFITFFSKMSVNTVFVILTLASVNHFIWLQPY
jgi:hypothetical protein